MTSIVIAAHNEAAVLGRCLDALLADPPPGPLDITVVANGCTDATAEVAAARDGVRVVVLDRPGKAGALNAGDAVARGFPRIYLDADIVLSTGALGALVAAVDRQPAPLAVVPGRTLVTAGRPVAVRAFYAVNTHLPVYRHSLFGRGAIALSAAGRARFTTFPEVTADDLYLDSLFGPDEKREVAGATSYVQTPRRTGDLIRRLARVRAGNAAMRAAAVAPGGYDGSASSGYDGSASGGAVRSASGGSGAGARVRRAARSSWLRDVVLPRPWLAPAAACYVAITVAAALRARRLRASGDTGWGRDESTRQSVGAAQENNG